MGTQSFDNHVNGNLTRAIYDTFSSEKHFENNKISLHSCELNIKNLVNKYSKKTQTSQTVSTLLYDVYFIKKNNIYSFKWSKQYTGHSIQILNNKTIEHDASYNGHSAFSDKIISNGIHHWKFTIHDCVTDDMGRVDIDDVFFGIKPEENIPETINYNMKEKCDSFFGIVLGWEYIRTTKDWQSKVLENKQNYIKFDPLKNKTKVDFYLNFYNNSLMVVLDDKKKLGNVIQVNKINKFKNKKFRFGVTLYGKGRVTCLEYNNKSY